MQDLAELHRSSRPATFLTDLGKPKASSPKNQVTALIDINLMLGNKDSMKRCPVAKSHVFPTERCQSEVRVQRGEEVRLEPGLTH